VVCDSRAKRSVREGNTRQLDQQPTAIQLPEVDDLIPAFPDFVHAGDHVGELRQSVLVTAMRRITGRNHRLAAGLAVGKRLRKEFVALIAEASHQTSSTSS